MAEVLRDEGYATFAVGKWHLCAMENASAAGPYDQWPCQRGFDRFYGFMEGETDQFHPELVYDNHMVEPPATPEEGYHLSEDLVDHAIGFVHDTVSIRPDRPFFLYLAFGATHAPHQAPDSYLEKYRGRYDEGWDVARERWFATQVASFWFSDKFAIMSSRAKEVGEGPIVCTLPAVANAVANALGEPVNEMPITPWKILQILGRRAKG